MRRSTTKRNRRIKLTNHQRTTIYRKSRIKKYESVIKIVRDTKVLDLQKLGLRVDLSKTLFNLTHKSKRVFHVGNIEQQQKSLHNVEHTIIQISTASENFTGQPSQSNKQVDINLQYSRTQRDSIGFCYANVRYRWKTVQNRADYSTANLEHDNTEATTTTSIKLQRRNEKSQKITAITSCVSPALVAIATITNL